MQVWVCRCGCAGVGVQVWECCCESAAVGVLLWVCRCVWCAGVGVLLWVCCCGCVAVGVLLWECCCGSAAVGVQVWVCRCGCAVCCCGHTKPRTRVVGDTAWKGWLTVQFVGTTTDRTRCRHGSPVCDDGDVDAKTQQT